MNDYKKIIWSNNEPYEIFSIRTEEIIISFRKYCGWKYLNDIAPFPYKNNKKEILVYIRRNNPAKYTDYSIHNWLKNDN